MNLKRKNQLKFLSYLILKRNLKTYRYVIVYLFKNKNVKNVNFFLLKHVLQNNLNLIKYKKLKNLCFYTSRFRGFIRLANSHRLSFQNSAKLGQIPGIVAGEW